MESYHYFDGNLWWSHYSPANIEICHDLLAIEVAGQVGQSLEVEINAESVFRNILQVLVSEVFNEEVGEYVEGNFLIFLGGQAGHPRLFVSSLNGNITAQVARIVELLLEAYKKAMGQRSDGCKAEGGSDSKDKEGGDLLLRNMLPSGSISFKKKHWMINQDLLGLNLFGLKEEVLIRRTVGSSEVARKRFASSKKESDKKLSSLQRMEVKCSEVKQNLRGLDLYGVRDSCRARRAISPFVLAEMIASAQAKVTVLDLEDVIRRHIGKLIFGDMKITTGSYMPCDELEKCEMFARKEEARHFYEDVVRKIHEKYEDMIRKCSEEWKRKSLERNTKRTKRRMRSYGKAGKICGDVTRCVSKSGEELQLACDSTSTLSQLPTAN